jgi:hypothetical protein
MRILLLPLLLLQLALLAAAIGLASPLLAAMRQDRHRS